METLVKIVDRGDNKVRTIHYNYDRNILMKDMASDESVELRQNIISKSIQIMNLNLNIDNYGGKSVVPVKCREVQGTAFI